MDEIAPRPYHLQQFGEESILICVDHASNYIPQKYKNLGLDKARLQSHITWDIGSSDLAIDLAKRLECQLIKASFSRLLIDPNRSLNADDLIVTTSDQHAIPGNLSLTTTQRQARIDSFYLPYHTQLQQLIKTIKRASEKTNKPSMMISLHSFTPQLKNAQTQRPWHAALLWNKDKLSAKHAIQWLTNNTDWTIGDNQPYDGKHYNYTLDTHAAKQGIPHLTFEIRQDLLSHQQQIIKVSDYLQSAIRFARNC